MGIPVNVTSVLISRIIEKENDGYLHNDNIEMAHDSLAFVVLLPNGEINSDHTQQQHNIMDRFPCGKRIIFYSISSVPDYDLLKSCG